MGIIGRNGAGKSTLLKILSRITSPTTGSVKIRGRIASLLEVGTGFHPELTGRENIYLNGAILGMRKKEITRKFDEIVDFSGVERYVDTPVKRYSSGMYVRLAFAVAAHLESEILIVDEVLAVGDAEFQKKCLGKMGEVSKGEGRTVLFVSHNLAAVETLCGEGILLNNGKTIAYGNITEVLNAYLNNYNSVAFYQNSEIVSKFGQFLSVKLFNEDGQNTNVFKDNSKPYIEIEFELFDDYQSVSVVMLLKDSFETHIYSNADTDLNELLLKRKKGKYKVSVDLDIHNLNTGNYKVQFSMGIVNVQLFDEAELSFAIERNNFLNTGARTGLLISLKEWRYQNL